MELSFRRIFVGLFLLKIIKSLHNPANIKIRLKSNNNITINATPIPVNEVIRLIKEVEIWFHVSKERRAITNSEGNVFKKITRFTPTTRRITASIICLDLLFDDLFLKIKSLPLPFLLLLDPIDGNFFFEN